MRHFWILGQIFNKRVQILWDSDFDMLKDNPHVSVFIGKDYKAYTQGTVSLLRSPVVALIGPIGPQVLAFFLVPWHSFVV
uniref:Uncharacterized protein n=1 Tax=Setaria digitata TaxID=48799 RepID=A0A915Q7U8_9BILA